MHATFSSIIVSADVISVTAQFANEAEQTVDMNERDYYRGNGAPNDDLDMTNDNDVKIGALVRSEYFRNDVQGSCLSAYGCMLQFKATIDLTYKESERNDGGRHNQSGGVRTGRRRLVDVSVTANESMGKVGEAIAVILAKPAGKKPKTYKCEDKTSKKGCMAASKATKTAGKKGPVDGPCFWKAKKCYGSKREGKTLKVFDGINKRTCKTLAADFGCRWNKKCECEH